MTQRPQTVHSSTALAPEQVDLIKNTVARGASDDELKLFLLIAQKSGLDPFTRQIHFVKRSGRGTVQTGIDGYRAIAERSGELAGIDDPIYDSEDGFHPRKATVTVYRMVGGQRVAFTASARWNEYVPVSGQDFMWQKMPYLMLGKVAEALALRKAFPNDLSGLYTDEEMQQGTVTDGEVYEADGSMANQQPLLPSGDRRPSVTQMRTIEKIMKQKGYTEEDVSKAGLPKLQDLTGGRAGSASKVIEWLIRAKKK